MGQQQRDKRTWDTPGRSFAKAISWRVIASSTTFIISWLVFSKFSTQSQNEIMKTASAITAIELVSKLIIYYMHERLWTNINWGKNWRTKAREQILKRRQKEEQ
ncbi:MAG: hypothetical protein B7C24_07050 [Bacteroidetes bacterium 4572_77]|nr:MAG: hypothetical protein B7C24_07050 [Bacteroidetes bacterium 4572_77]